LPDVAVTGATGQIGGRVARLLAERGVTQRLIVREPINAPALPGAEVAQASYEDAAAMRDALRDVKSLVLVSAHGHPERVSQHMTAIDAAVAAGVERIVYLSFLAASADATFTNGRDHFHTEAHLRRVGVASAALRASFYTDEVARWCSPAGVISGPAADGRVAWVTREDIAAVAVAVLSDPRYDGGVYDITGPEALTLAETAAALSRVTGRVISFRNQSLDQARASRAATGAPDWRIEGWVSSYAAIGEGTMNIVSDTVRDITGVAATSLDQYLAAHPQSYRHLVP
jgi:NAD(P)H dehydrogenase (quinone)